VGAWGGFGPWGSVEGRSASLSAGTTSHTFLDLCVQTFDEAGAPETRTQYRVVETMLAGKGLTYETSADGVVTYTGTVTLGGQEFDVAATASNKASAKAKDSKDGSVTASVEEVRVSNELTERQTFFGLLQQIFGLKAESDPAPGQTPAAPEPTHDADAGTKTYTYTIHNDMKNYGSNGELSFVLEALDGVSEVTVRNENGEDLTFTFDQRWNSETYSYDILPSGFFSVFANEAADITIALTLPEEAATPEPTIEFATPRDLTNSSNLCENYPNGTAVALVDDMCFRSQQAAPTLSLNKFWRDGNADKNTIDAAALGLKLQARQRSDGAAWSDEDVRYWVKAGTTFEIPDAPNGTQTNTSWTWHFDKTLYTWKYSEDSGWTEVDYRLEEISHKRVAEASAVCPRREGHKPGGEDYGRPHLDKFHK
jgi:hypothetical protein